MIILLITFGNWQLVVVNSLFHQGGDTNIKKGDGKTISDLADESKYAEIIENLKCYILGEGCPPSESDGLKSQISHQDEMLLARSERVFTALQVAAYGNHVRILEKLWVWAEEAEVNGNEIKKGLLLAKDRYGFTAWHVAVHSGSLEAIETLCSFAREVKLKPDEMLLARTENGSTLLHIAAYGNNVAIIETLWVWVDEAEVNEIQLKKKMLLAKDNEGYTAWDRAAQEGSLEAIEKLRSLGKEAGKIRDEL